MGVLFGTDGVRGIANVELTPEMAFDLGRAGSYVLAQQDSDSRPRIMVGKDTRASGDMLEAALVAGICSTGADALTLGTIPTPAVAYLTQRYGASCGIVISASHNPMQDNGIKFFGPNGYKLPDEIEARIESIVLSGTSDLIRPEGSEVGRIYDVSQATDRYVEFLRSCYSGQRDLSNLTVVLDCANGAAYQAAPKLWEELGARVIPIHYQPNGININANCGSTHTELVRKAVVECNADLGIAYDGDADRCIAIDENGTELDGDYILAICALDMARRGVLNPGRIAATVMSNIGLDIALKQEGILVDSCAVGDRYVLERMLETGALLGGEQSGHIIFLQHATTGDGLLTSIKLAEVLQNSGLPLSKLAEVMEKQPQLLVNVKLEDKDTILAHPLVEDCLRQAESKLGEKGKLVVRPSGTEPLVRLMAQGPDQQLLQEVIDGISAAIKTAQQG